jgi:hypothetical protein
MRYQAAMGEAMAFAASVREACVRSVMALLLGRIAARGTFGAGMAR